MKTYWTHALSIPAAGGLGYNFIYPEASPSGLTFTVSISLPNHSLAQYPALIQPLLTDLNALGIRVPMPTLKRSYAHNHNPYPPHTHHPLSKRGGVLGELTGHTLLSSRLFPHTAFTSSALNITHAAIRHAVESGGYTFHGMNYAPPLPPIDSAINPAFYNTVLHAQMYERNSHWDGLAPIVSRASLSESHARLQRYMQVWRDVAGTQGGSYVNEGDAQDVGWQNGFWGGKYEGLREVKKKWDSEGVFWVVGGVGSEGWEVRDWWDGEKKEGLGTQDGRLCRVRGE
jgi:hypothetical protein